MEQENRPQNPIQINAPISIDMTIGDDSSSSRLAKVKHQGVEETVKVMNRVLRKMSAGVKLEIVKSDTSPEPEECYGLPEIVTEEPVVVNRA